MRTRVETLAPAVATARDGSAASADTASVAPAGKLSGVSSGAAGPRAGGPWIYGPGLDLLVGCGAWSAPLLLVAALLPPTHTHAWAVAFYALAIVFNYPHFMATVYRAYHTRGDFRKYKCFTVHLTILLALTGVMAHTFPRLVPWIFTLYICWSPWHYTGQNYGLLLMFVRRGGAALEAAERRWLRAAFVASFVMLLASFETGGSNDAMILSLGLPARLTIPLRAGLGLIFAICAWGAFSGLLRRSGWRAMIAPLTLLVTQFLWFVLPTLLELGAVYQIPQTRYSSGILAVLHSAQYLWITSYYQKRDARAAGQSTWKMSGYWIALIAGGIALFIPGPWLVSYAFRFDFTTSFLIFTALVNIHHFLLDGAIWKLRDSRVASMLVGASTKEAGTKDPGAKRSQADASASKTTPKSERKNAAPASAAPGPWFAQRLFSSAVFRVTVVALLFLWGGADQLRFALGTDEGNLPALSRAARLNPYDAAVEARIASVETTNGKPADAIESLSRAVAINPYSQASQEALARVMIQSGRYADAYAFYGKMLTSFPHDADALLNYGMLAEQFGHPDEAIDAWQRSLQVDPPEINAHMYLAGLYDQRHDFAAGAQHWYAYLQLASARTLAPGSNAGASSAHISPDDEISALVQLSDDESRLNQMSAAITGYRSATTWAERAGNAKLQGAALAHLGDAQDKAGDTKGAASSYQRLLALDAKGTDSAGAASDWFNYSEFLERHGKPDELAYACLLEAESMLDNGSELDAVQSAGRRLATKLGTGAAGARKNEEDLLKVATSLAPATF